MPEPIKEVRYRFQPLRSAASRQRTATRSLPVGAALPRITRLMALAIKLDALSQQYSDLGPSELARRGCISRTRLTQILNLLNLAPDIQERLLWLPPLATGREMVSEKSLRWLTGEYRWERQRERFEQLLSRRGAPDGADRTHTCNTSGAEIRSAGIVPISLACCRHPSDECDDRPNGGKGES